MLRVLVTVTPRMYRQAIALSIQRQRPGLDVRVASSEAAEGELIDFRPHLLVHNDNDRLGPEAVEDVPRRVEVQYSDGMDARIRRVAKAVTPLQFLLSTFLGKRGVLL
jgi:hypothetical protein